MIYDHNHSLCCKDSNDFRMPKREISLWAALSGKESRGKKNFN